MNFLKGDTRRQLVGGLQGLVPAAASFFGFRVGRRLILRISSLLALRTVVSSVQLPLDHGVVSYAWSFMFTALQASVAMAAAANIFDLGGLLGFLGSKLFSSASDAAFVTLYGNVVLVVGPLCGLVEVAVVTFEIMRLSRLASEKMFASERSGHGKLIRYAIICAMCMCTGVSLLVVYLVTLAYNKTVSLVMTTVLALIYSICLTHSDGHLLEATVLGLFASLTFALGLVEEFDSPTALLNPFLLGPEYSQPTANFQLFTSTYSLISPEARALILLYTSIILLTSMSRAPRFFRLVQIGVVAMEQEESSVNAQPIDQSTETESPEPTSGFVRAVLNTVVLAALTFRFLVWTGEIHTGEYLPALCRAVQVAGIVVLYRIYLGSDEDQQPQVVAPEPLRDIAGNIIENPK